MIKRRFIFMPMVVAATLMFQLAMPIIARADDGIPPAPDTPAAEVTPDPSAGTDVSTVEAAADPAEIPLLAQVPEGTDVVVLNADGSVEPLATQAAAEIIATGDPVWCPIGQMPGDVDCLDNGGSGYSSMTALLTAMDGSSPADGTIWIEDSYDSSTNDSSVVSFALGTTNLSSWVNNSLTIQGGWDGISGSSTITGQSTFTVPLIISNWNAGVTINDILSNGSTGYGLDIHTTGDIALSNVDVTGAGFDGAYLANNAGTGSVSVDNSTFSGNDNIGLQVWTNGTITLDTVDASTNAEGADLTSFNTDTTLLVPVISVTNSTFNDNTFTGLFATTEAGDISLTDVTAGYYDLLDGDFGNQYGAWVWVAGAGDVTVNGGTFNSNNTPNPEEVGPGAGLIAGTSSGDVTLTGVTAELNDLGAQAYTGSGNVLIDGGSFSNNTLDGLYASSDSGGNVTLNTVIANANGTVGSESDGAVAVSFDGNVSVTGGTFDNNSSIGLILLAADTRTVSLTNVQANGNALKGAYIAYMAPCGSTGGIVVDLNGGTYTGNGAYGIYALVGPAGTVNILSTPTYGTNGGVPSPSIYDLLVNTDIYPCPPPEPEPGPKPEPKPYNTVQVPATGGTPVEQNCTDFSGTTLVLPGSDKVSLPCPTAGELSLESLTTGTLPGSLPVGPEFVSGMQVGLTQDGLPVTVLADGSLTVAFKLPEDAKPSDHFAILYWDPTAKNGAGDWVELPNYAARPGGNPLVFALHPDVVPDDLMRILSGTRVKGNYVKAMVNFPGVFVLVKK